MDDEFPLTVAVDQAWPCTYPRTRMLTRPIRVVAHLKGTYVENGKLVRAIQMS
jgi:hypothetical protein